MTTCNNCGSAIYGDLASGLCPNCLIQIARGDSPYQGNLAAITSPPLTPDQLNGRIPGIEIVQFIGRGGMGAVYRGYQVDLDRAVAVKILPVELAGDPVFVERFRQEARALAQIDHPNIVRIFGSGVAGELCYIVMELVEGVTLREAISKRSVDPQAALRIIPQICSALEYAHGNGIVHRDIKPENILLGNGGKVKVADFGLAKLSSAEPGKNSLTMTGARLGTLRYMAPEQFDGENVDHRSDIYAFGVVIYELLTGRVPMGHFPPASDTPGVDPRIDAVVMQTLQHEPAQRYQTASEIENDLFNIAKNNPTAADRLNQANANHARQFNRHVQHPNRHSLHGKEWKSQATFMGYPLLHIAYGYDAITQKKLIARGVIAIGDVAVGGLAIGGVAFGLLSLGGFSMGITAMGGAAIGLQAAYGGAAIGGLAIGGAAVGLLAIGGGAAGLLAMGGGAIGYLAMGGGAKGSYTYDYRGWSDAVFTETSLAKFASDPLFGYWIAGGMTFSVIAPLLLILFALVIGWVSSKPVSRPNPMPAELKTYLLQSIGGLVGLIIGAIFILPIPFTISKQFQREMQREQAEQHLESQAQVQTEIQIQDTSDTLESPTEPNLATPGSPDVE